jgi:hypothetical protein
MSVFLDNCKAFGLNIETRNLLYLLNRNEKLIRPYKYFLYTKGTHIQSNEAVKGTIRIPLPHSKLTVWGFTTKVARDTFINNFKDQADFIEF